MTSATPMGISTALMSPTLKLVSDKTTPASKFDRVELLDFDSLLCMLGPCLYIS